MNALCYKSNTCVIVYEDDDIICQTAKTLSSRKYIEKHKLNSKNSKEKTTFKYSVLYE